MLGHPLNYEWNNSMYLITDYNLVDNYTIQIKLKIKNLELLISKNVI